MRRIVVGLVLLIHFQLHAQVDTSYVYNTSTPYGTLDIRIAKSATRYYYLEEGKTFAFRESSPGVKTNTYRDMTSWDSSPYGQGNMKEKNGTLNTFVMNYRLLPPQGYNPSYSPGYPLVVFIHGAGERGNCWENTCYHGDRLWKPATNDPPAPTAADSKLLNNDHNLLHGGSALLTASKAAGTRLPNDPSMPARAFPGFVLFPQNMNGWDVNSVQDAIKLVRLISKKYNIDENRIYIQGLSNGGYGVYEAIKRAPWLFATAYAMSAVSDASIISKNLQSTVAHIPLWVFQGGQDSNPTPARTNNYVKKFREAGMVVRYSLYPELGHGTWNNAFKETDYYKYFLSKNKSNIHTFAGSTATCGTTGEGLKMELAAGFRAYQWEKNGVIISGATDNIYIATTPGTYRARFSRKLNPGASDWNQWSAAVTVTESNPAKPVLDQVGSVVLKDLNGLNDAKLKASSNFAKYKWYKNGTLLPIADSVYEPVIKSTSGNGAYTLVVSGFDNCPSPASNAKYIFFTDTAPINITSPEGFTATTPSSSSVKLTWTQSSTNESGFEIWRRKKLTSTTFTKWEMVTLTAANVTTYTDLTTEPSATYEFKIRAVGNAGRSGYLPTTTNGLVVNTPDDSTPPTAPANLTAAAVAINTIKLSWSASTDNSGIRQYRIYYGGTSVATGSSVTNYTLSGLTLNTNYAFTVKAEDLGGNLSAASNSAAANTYVSGLFYEHSTGAWIDLDDINWTAPAEFTGKVTTFTLSPRTQEDYFNFEFDGFLYINVPGVYTFQTTSSDGSRLELDGTVLVSNDGVHANRTITSTAVTLTSGPKRINVKYFEFDESHSLTVRYKGPDTGNSFLTIPASALKSGTPGGRVATEAEPVAEQTEERTLFSVYPNPTNPGDINVTMEKETVDNSPVQIRMIDFSGREIFVRDFQAEEVNQGVKILPAESLQNGIYLMQIKQNGKTSQHRISIKN
jgi:predicted esterase